MDQPISDNPEVAAAYRALSGVLDRLLATIDGLTPAELNWQPPAAGGNSLTVLIIHTLANVEENILEILGGESVGRNREAEFLAQDVSADALRARHQEIIGKVRARLATLPPGELDRERTHHRRGTIAGRWILWIAVRHAAEHLGQAELTRDLLKAAELNTPAQ